MSEAKHKIKLCTVLSACKPHQTAIPPVDDDAEPDWESLCAVMKTRHPNHECGDIKRAVKQCILFPELKQKHNDCESKKFSPSATINEVAIKKTFKPRPRPTKFSSIIQHSEEKLWNVVKLPERLTFLE